MKNTITYISRDKCVGALEGTEHAMALCSVQYVHVPCGFDITNDRNFKRFKKVLLPSIVTVRVPPLSLGICTILFQFLFFQNH